MTGFVDTNIIVRYLTNTPPDLGEAASRILEREDRLYLTDAALAEAAYVLTSYYRLPRTTVADSLIQLCQQPNIELFRLEKGFVLQGLYLCRESAKVSFDDALIWAAARSSDIKRVYTFDKDFPQAGIEVLGLG